MPSEEYKKADEELEAAIEAFNLDRTNEDVRKAFFVAVGKYKMAKMKLLSKAYQEANEKGMIRVLHVGPGRFEDVRPDI